MLEIAAKCMPNRKYEGEKVGLTAGQPVSQMEADA